MPSSRFSGLMSRWMTCFAWQYSSARASDAMYLQHDKTPILHYNLSCTVQESTVRCYLQCTSQHKVLKLPCEQCSSAQHMTGSVPPCREHQQLGALCF